MYSTINAQIIKSQYKKTRYKPPYERFQNVPGIVSSWFRASTIIVILTFSPLASSELADVRMGFDVEIKMSDKAAAKLRASAEGVTALVSYYGDPSSFGEQYANEAGAVDLASETIELAVPLEPVHISGYGVAQSRLEWIDGEVKVNINVYSSRKAHSDNILDCDFIDGELKTVVSASPVTLHCSLIKEGRQAASMP